METFFIDSDGLPAIKKTVPGKLDYSFDWTDWLTEAADEIASYEIAAHNGLTVESHARAGSVVTVVVSGGVHGQSYLVTCKITTASTPARIESRSIRLHVVFTR